MLHLNVYVESNNVLGLVDDDTYGLAKKKKLRVNG
jgi:hypothetical protein